MGSKWRSMNWSEPSRWEKRTNMEYEEFLTKAEERRIARQTGRALPQRGIMGYSDAFERNLPTLPAYTYFQRPLQDSATGKLFLTLDLNGFDDSGTAGLQ